MKEYSFSRRTELVVLKSPDALIDNKIDELLAEGDELIERINASAVMDETVAVTDVPDETFPELPSHRLIGQENSDDRTSEAVISDLLN